MRQLLDTLVAQIRPAEHQQQRHRPGQQGTDQKRRGNQDHLVEQRPAGHRPDHRQLAVGLHPGDLLGVERQVVAQHAGGLLRRHLGHQRDVVEERGDVIDQCEQTATGHRHASMC